MTVTPDEFKHTALTISPSDPPRPPPLNLSTSEDQNRRLAKLELKHQQAQAHSHSHSHSHSHESGPGSLSSPASSSSHSYSHRQANGPTSPKDLLPTPPPPSRLLVVGTVTFYLVAALVMVMVNKWVLNSIPAPLFFLFCQLVIAVILLKACAWFGIFSLPVVHLAVCKALVPLITINVLGLTFNTYCLQYVDSSFYQVARGLILPFTVLASYLFLGTRSSLKIHISIAIVCIGFVLGVSSERLTVSHLGVALGVFSSLTTSIHAIIMKQALSKVSGTIDMTYYTNLLSAFVILPLIIIMGETGTVLELVKTDGAGGLRTFLVGTVVTGIFGFLICVAGVLSIKVTSPVTHMISSAVRGVFQTALSALIFGDVITTGRLGSIVIILAGSIYYTWVKDQELDAARHSKPAVAERYPMRDMHEAEALVVNVDRSNEEEMDDDDRELAEAARALGIDPHHDPSSTS
ncbi:hypothetical protein CROQUDRAFT_668870 [Cronartium quercuum f. sp. fusiforme G11]|uniref:Sugar phosphate transporter domain-containing protein n=1 Tax=Cronartium quercuum f. sp. fusiforme G11 TaxID=708437 RepID=A0A9P6TFI4_9BASI|nr:hypothetical protein CROQUDRAFT_668870 [Cronartium quercuum f. sp. fusiforme G11]